MKRSCNRRGGGDNLNCRVHEGVLAVSGVLVAILLSAATCRAVQHSFIFTHKRPNDKNKYVVKLTTTKHFEERAHLGVKYRDGGRTLKTYESDSGRRELIVLLENLERRCKKLKCRS